MFSAVADDGYLVWALVDNKGTLIVLPRGWYTLYALFGRWCPHCKIHKAYMPVLEPMRQFKHRHACARIYSCLICMCGHRNERAFCLRRCQMAHTCGRSVESIAVIWKSEKQRAREEMKQTTEGSHSAPRLCFFKLFSSHCRRREQCAA